MPWNLKSGVAIALGAVFMLLCGLHVYWALGGKSVGSAVVPIVSGKPAFQPSRFATMAVATALALAALVVLVRGDLLRTALPPWLSTWAAVGLGAVFVLRAVGEFRLVGFFKSVRGTPFAFWDTWLYSPLCLALGLGALWLATTPRSR